MGTKDIRRELANKPVIKKTATNSYNSNYLQGPGSALKYINVHRFHTASCNSCHNTAKKMNTNGPRWCLLNVELLANELHENAKEKKWSKLLDTVAYSLYGLEKHKKLIREAVSCHILETTRKRYGLRPLHSV